MENIYALVDSSNIVQNIIVWDGDTSNWQPPSGQIAIEVTDATGIAQIGWTYVNGVFVSPTN